MATGTVTDNDSISAFGDYAVYALARTGGNGAASGDPEIVVGDSNGDATNRTEWDSNLRDGFDTGWQDVTLTLNPGGGANGVTWDVGGQSAVYSGASYTTIGSLIIRAAVETAAFSGYEQLVVQFFKAGVQTETYVSRSTPQVDDTGEDLPVSDEEYVTVTPANADNDQVVVTSRIKFSSPSTDPPDTDDMFIDIYVISP